MDAKDDGVIYLGIDPGKTGGVAALDEHGNMSCARCSGGHDLLEFIHAVRSPRMTAAIEKFPHRGGEMAIGFSKLHASAGEERGVMIAWGIPFREVNAKEWQKAMGITDAGGGQRATRRERLKKLAWDTARSLYPGTKILKDVADAVLIATWLRDHTRQPAR